MVLERLVIAAQVRAHEVRSGHDPDEAPGAHDGQPVDGSIDHESGGLPQGAIRVDRHRRCAHGLPCGLGGEAPVRRIGAATEETIQRPIGSRGPATLLQTGSRPRR